MKYLSDIRNVIKKQIGENRVMLLLDYDGTLAPISERPDKAVFPCHTKEVLKKLAKNQRCQAVIVTGRNLKNIKKIAGIKNIIYAGNHGLQIEGHKIKFAPPVDADYKKILRRIEKELVEKLSTIKGFLAENKEFSLSVHYRLVSRGKISYVKKIFYEVTASYNKDKKIKTETGKKVLEVKPRVNWNKGKAAMWLLNREKKLTGNAAGAIYLGDDVTDEDAFKALKNKGLTVFVGRPRKSYAKYYLKNTQEVFKFLKELNSFLCKYKPHKQRRK